VIIVLGLFISFFMGDYHFGCLLAGYFDDWVGL
jgi:hypothetical protein